MSKIKKKHINISHNLRLAQMMKCGSSAEVIVKGSVFISGNLIIIINKMLKNLCEHLHTIEAALHVLMVSGCCKYSDTLRLQGINMLLCQSYQKHCVRFCFTVWLLLFAASGSKWTVTPDWLNKWKQTSTCAMAAMSNLTTHSTWLQNRSG